MRKGEISQKMWGENYKWLKTEMYSELYFSFMQPSVLLQKILQIDFKVTANVTDLTLVVSAAQ